MTTSDSSDLLSAVEVLARFLHGEPLTSSIGTLEQALTGSRGSGVNQIVAAHGITAELLFSASAVREHLGRISDVIHAAAIALALPQLLDPDERLGHPSLGAGNDPSRPYDVETNLRVAEFKLGRWTGSDAMRKRLLVKDFVHLGADPTDRIRELYVIGPQPLRFLNTTRASIAWALDRAPGSQELFTKRYGSLQTRVSVFVAEHGAEVSVIDLEQRLPLLFGATASASD
jgi:hypothetical protein